MNTETTQVTLKSKIFKKGTILFREGEMSTEMYYIETGSVAILCKDSENSNVPVSVIKKGSFLGEFAFFDQKPRSATVMMMEDSTLKVIDKTVLRSIGKNGLFIIKGLIEKMRSMNKTITEMNEVD